MIEYKEELKPEIPMTPLEPSEEIPSIPMTPLEPSEPKFSKFWVEIEERGFVVGYSSSIMYDSSIMINSDDLPEDFETYYAFYRLDENLELTYDRTRVDELIAEREEEANKPTQEELMEAELKELKETNAKLQSELKNATTRSEMTEMALLELYDMILTR